MGREQGLEQRLAGNGVGVLGFLAERGKNLAPDPFQRLRIETRPGQRQGQEFEGRGLVFDQGPEPAAKIVPPSIEAQGDDQVLEPPLKDLAVEIAGAFVEQGGNHVGQALLALGVECRAAVKGEAHGDDRVGVIAHQPGLDAAQR